VVFTVLFIIERALINGAVHNPGVSIGGVDYYSINDIKLAISKGGINVQGDLIKAYTTMMS
jgi:hypothetical protein